MDDPTWIWLTLGGVLMLLELIVPGLIVVFLGVAAVLVGGAVRLGWVTQLHNALVLWFILSLTMVFFLRSFFERLLPGETERGSTDEDQDTFGTLVSVVEGCGTSKGSTGRILLRGVEWPARATSDTPSPNTNTNLPDRTLIKKGATAEVVGRDNLTWLIRPASLPPKESS